METKYVKEQVIYWFSAAAYDYKVMESLYGSRQYAYSLFLAHLMIEKLLKAFVVHHTKEYAPYIHDLSVLHSRTGVLLTEEELSLIDEMNGFNISARYPDEKFLFYKKCTKEFTDTYYPKIIRLFNSLCQKAKSEIL